MNSFRKMRRAGEAGKEWDGGEEREECREKRWGAES